MFQFFSQFKKTTKGIIVNDTKLNVFYLIHSELLNTGSTTYSEQFGAKFEVSRTPQISGFGSVKEEISQSFSRINGGSICPPGSRTHQGLSNIKKDGSCHVSVYLNQKGKIVFLCKNIVIKSNKDVRIKVRFDKYGRLGIRSILSNEYHQIVDGYEPSVCGEQPDDFDLEGYGGLK